MLDNIHLERKSSSDSVDPNLEFELKADGIKDDGYFEGYAAIFGNVDNGNDVCVKGCFEKSILEHKNAKTMPLMFWNHDKTEPIGEWLSFEEDAVGLKVKGKLWVGKGIQKAEQAHLMMKSASIKGMSIGYHTRRKDVDKKNGTRLLQELDVQEMSIVPFAMNRKTKITMVKSDEKTASCGLEGILDAMKGDTVDPYETIIHEIKSATLDLKKMMTPEELAENRKANGKFQNRKSWMRNGGKNESIVMKNSRCRLEKKYSPDQSRDEFGRFAEGDGGGSGGSGGSERVTDPEKIKEQLIEDVIYDTYEGDGPSASKRKGYAKRLDKPVRAAVAAGWKPTRKEIESLAFGEESVMRAAEAKIPGGHGAKIKRVLDRMFEDADGGGDTERDY